MYKVFDAAKYEITDYKNNNSNINYNSANLAYKRTIDRSANQQCNHLDPAYRFYRTTSEYFMSTPILPLVTIRPRKPYLSKLDIQWILKISLPVVVAFIIIGIVALIYKKCRKRQALQTIELRSVMILLPRKTKLLLTCVRAENKSHQVFSACFLKKYNLLWSKPNIRFT